MFPTFVPPPASFLLAATDWHNPLLWALLIGWIMSVVLHEFAHGLVASLGGDYTIRERGGLTLNPLQYVDPMMSIVLPTVFLLMGGIPLPGGATYVRRDLLRSPLWQSAVSAAGPLMNLILFLGLCTALLPRVGWVNYHAHPDQWTTPQVFVAGLAFAQGLSVLLNLMPIPGLDGFGIIAPLLPPRVRNTLSNPQIQMGWFIGYFLVLQLHGVWNVMQTAIIAAAHWVGVPEWTLVYGFGRCLFGE